MAVLVIYVLVREGDCCSYLVIAVEVFVVILFYFTIAKRIDLLLDNYLAQDCYFVNCFYWFSYFCDATNWDICKEYK